MTRVLSCIQPTGDVHLGNLFLDGDRLGFLDWGIVNAGSCMRDASYLLTMAMDVEERRANQVDQLVTRFRAAERLTLVVPAEGTRSWVPQWKSGFYHIARAAGVPVVLGFLDYGRKIGGFGPAIRVTGDVRRDMDAVRAFYAPMRGKHHASTGTILLAEERAEPPAVA